jgi:BirA family biotin operon repressor/biotin-[acetyl-CoA-carboxylase] ligase
LVAEQDAIKYAIISFGLNVNQTSKQFPPEVAQIATSIRLETGKKQDRAEIFRQVLRELDPLYLRFKEDHGADVLSRWRRLSCTLGKRVTVRLREETVEGIARDVADDGSLFLEVDGKLRQISYGDVTILR